MNPNQETAQRILQEILEGVRELNEGAIRALIQEGPDIRAAAGNEIRTSRIEFSTPRWSGARIAEIPSLLAKVETPSERA